MAAMIEPASDAMLDALLLPLELEPPDEDELGVFAASQFAPHEYAVWPLEAAPTLGRFTVPVPPGLSSPESSHTASLAEGPEAPKATEVTRFGFVDWKEGLLPLLM
jgi:hypothetical protein